MRRSFVFPFFLVTLAIAATAQRSGTVQQPTTAQESAGKASAANSAFPGTAQWAGALAASDMTSLKALYSTNPPARFIGKDGKPADDISPESDFWQEQMKAGMSNPQLVSTQEDDKNGLHLGARFGRQAAVLAAEWRVGVGAIDGSGRYRRVPEKVEALSGCEFDNIGDSSAHEENWRKRGSH